MKRRQELLLKSMNPDNQHIFVANQVSPYWNHSYERELELKQKHCIMVLDRIMRRSKMMSKPITCELERIIPSPVCVHYRNKDEFSVMHGVDGNPKTVGFLVGRLSYGRAISVHPTHLTNIKEIHKQVAQVYEDFIRLSDLPANIKLTDGGVWRTLLVRSNEKGELLVVVTVNPSGREDTIIQMELHKLKDYFSKHLPQISLFYQLCPHTKCTNKVSPYQLLYGNNYILEQLNGYYFKISPDSFFQVNKLGAEVLYNTIFKVANLNKNTTLLDLCCGTGTISILASKFVKQAIGIEIVPHSVTDAFASANLNSVHNVNFLKGTVEARLKSLLQLLPESSEIVAIVNPGRAGLGLQAIKTLRQATTITKLVYISCKPDSRHTMQNFVALSAYITDPSPPFSLVKAIPVDMFPQTSHIELIMLYTRNSEKQRK